MNSKGRRFFWEGVPNHELEGNKMIAWPSCHAWKAGFLRVLSTALLGFATFFIVAEIFENERWACQGLVMSVFPGFFPFAFAFAFAFA